MTSNVNTITELLDTFRTENDCIDHLYGIKYGEGYICPKCGYTKNAILYSRRKVQCSRCSHQESITVGTVMAHSHVPLRKWFLAMHLVANGKRGISAVALSHELRINEKSAYYLLQRIRAYMAESGCLQHAVHQDGARRCLYRCQGR